MWSTNRPWIPSSSTCFGFFMGMVLHARFGRVASALPHWATRPSIIALLIDFVGLTEPIKESLDAMVLPCNHHRLMSGVGSIGTVSVQYIFGHMIGKYNPVLCQSLHVFGT